LIKNYSNCLVQCLYSERHDQEDMIMLETFLFLLSLRIFDLNHRNQLNSVN